jgi:hypothetical protein
MKKIALAIIFAAVLAVSCKKDEDSGPKLIFKFKFDSTQTRLNNFGNAATIPPGNAAQSPKFNFMSAHYIELAPDSLTLLGFGDILYRAAETTAGGDLAIDFSKSTSAAEGQAFYSVPIKNISPGTYKWLRVSLAYQNYDVKLKYVDPTFGTFYPTATVASFIGFNTYLTSYPVKNQTVTVNANKKQGYGAAEITSGIPVSVAPFTWQAPAGATTVPNPIGLTSPIPPGSCVVTGRFPVSLTVTGTETNDVIVTVSLSTNKSFEWKDKNGDGVFEPINGTTLAVEDSVVDMGVRGLIPIVN